MVSYADTLDCVGILAEEVEDARLLFGMYSPLSTSMTARWILITPR